MSDKKTSIHIFDQAAHALVNHEHLEASLIAAEVEIARLKRVVLLQERRWRGANPEAKTVRTLH